MHPMDPALHLLSEGDPEDEVAVLVRRTTADVKLPERVRIIAEFGPIATCRLRREDIIATRLADGVASLKAPHELGLETALDEADVFGAPLESDARRPDPAQATGQGVVIGIVDWGCDFAHCDFRRADGATRLLALWDQQSLAPGSPAQSSLVNSYGYGRVFLQADIQRALHSDNPYAALRYHPEDGDPDKSGAHGSHVLSIAAGSGGAECPGGLAPDADLVFVHFGSREGHSIGDSVRPSTSSPGSPALARWSSIFRWAGTAGLMTAPPWLSRRSISSSRRVPAAPWCKAPETISPRACMLPDGSGPTPAWSSPGKSIPETARPTSSISGTPAAIGCKSR
jgi:hypothetical protein